MAMTSRRLNAQALNIYRIVKADGSRAMQQLERRRAAVGRWFLGKGGVARRTRSAMRPGFRKGFTYYKGMGAAQKDTGHPKSQWELISDQGRATPFCKSLVLSAWLTMHLPVHACVQMGPLGAGRGWILLLLHISPFESIFSSPITLPKTNTSRNPGSGHQGKIIFQEPVPVQVCLLGGSCLSDAS